ncbi:hypothetical protein FB009_101120 [Sinorhizobium medicae]|uniref:hypothetical protein n=1 Tax=Sinorhizobium medicae TaxID=110321 RepID=UPI0011992519|nr:hypothetical protein [Sinorhizobium medicae]TWA44368.1 hypothetical protein FB009_101120 [Sinorhizobium medicae]UWU11047.1 hypothetical protein N2598_19855 [Sinorhizobium medicae]
MSASQNVVDMDLFRVRRGLEAKIAELIDLLDPIDTDCDIEDGFDEEPSLGWTAPEASYGQYGTPLDGEQEEDDPIEPNGDEQDHNGDEGDNSIGRLDGGSGL